MKQTAYLVNCLGQKLQEKTGSGEAGVLARRVFRDGLFDLIGPGGKVLLPLTGGELVAYFLPGEYRPERTGYNQKSLFVSFTVFLFAGEAPKSPLELAEVFRGSYILEDKKTAKVEPVSFTEDVLQIIADFPRYREQFQDKQTGGFAQKITLNAKILNCC
jgi:hypothetical protein